MGCYNSTIQGGDDKIAYATINLKLLPVCFKDYNGTCLSKKCDLKNCGFKRPHHIEK